MCPRPIPDSWIEYPDNHVYDGIATSDSDLDECRLSCTRNSSCTRLDWSAGASAGQRCWLHGHWSSSQSRRRGPGISHYELRRTTVANWVNYPDMHVRGGIASGATNLAGCKDICVNNASCTRIDWASGALVGQRCWIHGPWSSSESLRPAQDVTHVELYRGSDGFCGEQHVHSIISIQLIHYHHRYNWGVCMRLFYTRC